MKIGYIGLGIMGKPCALNLLRAGFEVAVWARRRESVEPLRAAGAEVKSSAAELAQSVDVLITNLSDTSDVREVLTGIASHAKPGLICIDMSTISPAGAREIAIELERHSVEFLDCPVSGGEAGAIAGTLTIMAGGKQSILERVMPVLSAMGKKITRIGTSGAGQVAKACNQIVVGVTIGAVAEALALARASGVDPEPVREALLGGFAASRVLEVHGRRIIDEDYRPGFKAVLHAKDLGIVQDTARDIGLTLPQTERISQLLAKSIQNGEGELDSSVIARQFKD